MDFARGIAICFLLLFHAAAIPALLHGVTMSHALVAVNDFMAPYRMPMLMLLSGMLLHRSLAKPLPVFYGGKVRGLLWPYLVWAVILLAARGDLELLPSPGAWIPVTYIWFLLFVFCYYCAAPIAARLPWWVVPALGLVGATVVADRGFISKFLLFSAYFYLGHAVAQSPRARGFLARLPVLLGLLMISVLGNLLLGGMGRPVAIAVSLTGVLAAVGLLGRYYRANALTAPIEAIGRRSIVYYLSHYPLMMGVGAVLIALGVTAGAAHVVVNLAMSLALGAALAAVTTRYPGKILVAFPAWKELRGMVRV